MHRRFVAWALTLLLAAAAGCSSERDKGVNKDQDKPKKAEEKH